MKKIAYTAIVLVLLTLAAALYLHVTRASIEKLPELKNGDLVFQTIKSTQTAAIIAATSSPYTHVGIIKINEFNKPEVIEAVGPVRSIPLERWIKQGMGKRLSIKRVKNLSTEQANKILEAAKKYYGRPYDFYFLFDKEKIYCSELVHYAFQDGPAITLGKEQQVKELNTNNWLVKSLMKQRWKNYPPCMPAKTFQECYKTIVEQKLVSPESIANDSKLKEIYSNY